MSVSTARLWVSEVRVQVVVGVVAVEVTKRHHDHHGDYARTEESIYSAKHREANSHGTA